MSESETASAHDEAPPSPPLTRLSLLLELQEQDLALDRLAYRRRGLPERAALTEVTARLTEQAARVEETQKEHDLLSARQLALDDRSQAVTARIAAIEQRLSSGRAGSYRDEQAMAEEAASLARQRREIEDQELEVMELLELLDRELVTLEEGISSFAEELALTRQQLALEEAAIDHEVATTRTTRDRLAPRVAPELAAAYERLRAKLGGIGAARLVSGACSGCHLQLPAGELDSLRHAPPDTVSYCDQCGRILVP